MKSIIDLQNKTILVTGASSGIGRAICQTISECGAKVIMIARREEQLKETLESLPGDGHRYYVYDLKDIDGIEVIVDQIVEENGKLDGFVHSAGVGTTVPLKQAKYGLIHDTMLINYHAFVEILRNYAKKKNNNAGSVVAISSMSSYLNKKAEIAYASSKAALDSAVRISAAELAAKNIRVNSIQPGWVKTEIQETYIERVEAENRGVQIAQTKVIEPEGVASVAAFLLSDLASVISGCAIVTNFSGGGR